MLLQKIVVTIVIGLFAYAVQGQPFKKGDFVLGGLYQTQVLGKQTAFEKIYGIQLSYFVNKRWALEYSLAYADVPFYPNYLKIYGGGLLAGYGAVLATNNINTDGLWLLVILGALVPEGVSYHLPINKNVTISPFTHLLSFDLGIDNTTFLHYNNTLGLRLNMVHKKIAIAPHAFAQMQYRSQSRGGSRTGYGLGATLRIVF